MPTETKQTSAKFVAKSMVTSSIVAIISIIIGVGFLIIPVIGWIIGFFLITAGIGFFIAGSIGTAASASTKKVFEGPCPHCGSPLTANLIARSNFDCPKCGERVIAWKGKFYTKDEFKEANRKGEIK